jgi:hypothetical protein
MFLCDGQSTKVKRDKISKQTVGVVRPDLEYSRSREVQHTSTYKGIIARILQTASQSKRNG